MRTEIKLEGKKKIKINTSLRWLFIYQEYFGHDILPDVAPMIDTFLSFAFGGLSDEGIDVDEIEEKMYSLETTTFIRILWALVKNADEDTPEVEQWSDDLGDPKLDDLAPKVIDILAESYLTSKKLKLLRAGLKQRRFQFMQSLSPESTED